MKVKNIIREHQVYYHIIIDFLSQEQNRTESNGEEARRKVRNYL